MIYLYLLFLKDEKGIFIFYRLCKFYEIVLMYCKVFDFEILFFVVCFEY